jgi:uncharacterized membrane protein YkoI
MIYHRLRQAGWVCLALAGAVSPAFAYDGQALAGKAAVTIEQARATALAVQPGQIVAEELEAEKGGSGLRYSFDIKASAQTHEVGIDAQSGHVLENTVEGSHPD